jgi:imidazole glycerol-phosphate synthase subunit HisF
MNTRIITMLNVQPPSVIKLVRFEGLRKLEFLSNLAKKYYDQGDDELFYIGIASSLYQREIFSEVVKKLNLE